MELPTELSSDFLRPLVNGWLGKIEAAEKHRAPWAEMAAECMDFYAKSARAMWDAKAGKRIFRGPMQSKFRMTINKAFELVAIYGPSLMWEVPHRLVTARKLPALDPELFGSPDDPISQQLIQQVQMELAQMAAHHKAIATLLTGWLNYTAVESALGGQSEMAVIDALIKGRGCLWAKHYNPPMSERTLTGVERDRPENLLIDPDFDSLDDAKWVARKVTKPVWEAERIFKLPPGTLKGKATLESSWSRSERSTEAGSESRRAAGQTNDLIEYYEIYSKTGVGVRLSGMETKLKDRFEEVVGDYAYLAIAKNVPWPLNCPAEFLKSGADDDAVRQQFSWPAPLWKDVADSWPVLVLDFFPDPESAWPIPPLAPVMGPLKFLNTMMGHLCNRIWSSSRDFIAVAESAMATLKTHLEKGEDLALLPIPEIQGDIQKVIAFLQQPQTNLDVWKIIEAVSELFDKGSGLYEVMYAANAQGTQNRTAEESRNKAQAAGIRPEYMQKKVVEWQSRVAAVESFLARWFVVGQDVQPLFGNAGSQLWEQFVMSSDVETVVRQMDYSVAASSIRRPNRDRDSANMSALMQSPFMKLISDHAAATGQFESMNELLQKFGEVNDMDLSNIRFEQPEVNPAEAAQQQEQQQMQAEMEMEQQKLQGEMQLKQMDMQSKQQQMELDAAKAQMDMQLKQMELQFDMQKGALELEFDERRHEQEMAQDQQRHTLDMRQQAVAGQQKLAQSAVEGQVKVEQSQAMSKEKIAATKAMAKAKPKPAAKPKPKAKK